MVNREYVYTPLIVIDGELNAQLISLAVKSKSRLDTSEIFGQKVTEICFCGELLISLFFRFHITILFRPDTTSYET